jgi:parallel beta helix pectate lyase-like protein
MMISFDRFRGLGPACVVLVMMMTCLVTVGEAATYYVYDDSDASTADGLSWDTAFREIQDAIDTAVEAGASEDEPAEVWVADGNYRGPGEYVVEMTEYVDLYGGFSGVEKLREERDWVIHQASIDGSYIRRCVKGANHVTIDGLVLKNGSTSEGEDGAGIFNDNVSPMIRNCTFTSNKTNVGNGGGIYNNNSQSTIINCSFFSNDSIRGNGGAIYNNNSQPIIINCTMNHNNQEEVYGGTIYNNYSKAIIKDCTFNRTNRAISNNNSQLEISRCSFYDNSRTAMENNGSSVLMSFCNFEDNQQENTYDFGRAMYNYHSSLKISDSTFVNNSSSSDGGAIYNRISEISIKNCSFSNNRAYIKIQSGIPYPTHGGAMYSSSSTVFISNSIFSENNTSYGGGAGICNIYGTTSVENSLFVGNKANISMGGAMLNQQGEINISNCNFVNNSPYCVYNTQTKLSLINSIFLGNNADLNPLAQRSESVRYNCISSDFSGEGNINTDPLFTDPNNDDFTLQIGSPCIDAGTRENCPHTDITGMGRPQGGLVDMGAYERIIGGGVFFSN